MKRLISLFVILSLLCSVACAEVVTVNLASATEEQLLKARDAIDARLAEIRLADAPVIDESCIIRGKGMEILTDVEVKNIISRFNVHSKGDVTVSCYNGNERLYLHDYIAGAQTIPMIIVEADEEWYIDFSPIGKMDSPYISGKGSYTSDVFVVSPPTIVTITLSQTAGYFDYTNINLRYVDKNGGCWIADTVMQLALAPQCIDYIIKPEEDAVMWFWTIDCSDNIEWSITAK